MTYDKDDAAEVSRHLEMALGHLLTVGNDDGATLAGYAVIVSLPVHRYPLSFGVRAHPDGSRCSVPIDRLRQIPSQCGLVNHRQLRFRDFVAQSFAPPRDDLKRNGSSEINDNGIGIAEAVGEAVWGLTGHPRVG